MGKPSMEELKAKIQWAWEETYYKGNLDALDEIYACDVVIHTPPQPEEVSHRFRDAAELDFEPATPLFDHPSDPFKVYAAYADGQRFLITQVEKGPAQPLTFILNSALLKR